MNSVKEAIVCVVMLAGAGSFAIESEACNAPGHLVNDITQVASGGCKLIEDITNDGVVKSICATVDEVSTIVNLVTSLRGDGGFPKSATSCTKLTEQVCATHEELSLGIDMVVAKRRERFLRGSVAK